MVEAERRRPENARLREKIHRIQSTSQQLMASAALVHDQAVAWAREGKLTDLPSAELGRELAASFAQQRQAVSALTRDIQGHTSQKPSDVAAVRISSEELAALLR